MSPARVFTWTARSGDSTTSPPPLCAIGTLLAPFTFLKNQSTKQSYMHVSLGFVSIRLFCLTWSCETLYILPAVRSQFKWHCSAHKPAVGLSSRLVLSLQVASMRFLGSKWASIILAGTSTIPNAWNGTLSFRHELHQITGHINYSWVSEGRIFI